MMPPRKMELPGTLSLLRYRAIMIDAILSMPGALK
jgi:hypothetical protein